MFNPDDNANDALSKSAAERVPVQKRPALPTLILASVINAVAVNIFLPSIPGMAKEFGVSFAFMQLGLSVFLGMNAVLQLVLGSLSDRYGRRPVLIATMALFAGGTVLCLLSHSALMFLIGRAIQASCAAGIVVARAIVRDVYNTRDAAVRISYLSVSLAIGPMLAPAIGGLLDANFGWRASFTLLLALGLVTLLVLVTRLPETRVLGTGPGQSHWRAYGQMLSSWNSARVALCAGLANGLHYAAVGSAPALAEGLLGIPTTLVGLWFAIGAGGYVTGGLLLPRLLKLLQFRTILRAGGIILLGGSLIILTAALAGALTPLLLFGPLVFVGFGQAMILPNCSVLQMSLHPRFAGAAAGLQAASQLAAGGIASTIAGILVGDGTNPHLIALFLVGVAALLVVIVWGLPNLGEQSE